MATRFLPPYPLPPPRSVTKVTYGSSTVCETCLWARGVPIPRTPIQGPMAPDNSPGPSLYFGAVHSCDVRFTPKSRHRSVRWQCPLCAKRGHSALRQKRRFSITASARTAHRSRVPVRFLNALKRSALWGNGAKNGPSVEHETENLNAPANRSVLHQKCSPATAEG
jgi:hypothetical protein